MAITIKHSAGDEVYWLSSVGFKKGIIKLISLSDNITICKGKLEKYLKTKYYVWDKGMGDGNSGDEVIESLIFTSYDEMIEHYKNAKP